jgi:signal transduction histidine kinase/CheY-like chemotaxis protein
MIGGWLVPMARSGDGSRPLWLRHNAMILLTAACWAAFAMWYAANGRLRTTAVSVVAALVLSALLVFARQAKSLRVARIVGHGGVLVNLLGLAAGAMFSGNEDSMFSWYILAAPTLAAFQLGSREAGWWMPPTLVTLAAVRLQGMWWPVSREFRAAGWEVVLTQMVLGLLFGLLSALVVKAYERRLADLERSEAAAAGHAREVEVARDQALAAAAARQLFVAHISHEIRTPLHGLLGMTELLLDGIHDPQHRAMLGTLRRSGESLLAIVNQVLDLAKLDARGLVLEQVSTNLRGLLEDALAIERPTADAKGLWLRLEVDEDLPERVVLDPTRLRQVLSNLLSNAVKFTVTGGVTVRVRWAAADRLDVEVVDTGPGIAPEHVERVFEPFAQGDASTTRRFGGTGLGLTISRALVEAMGGRLRLISAPGRGCVFRFDVQAEEGDGLVRTSEVVLRAPPDEPQTLQVLLADDHPVNLQVGVLLLRRLGLEVVVATDGEQACQRVAEGGLSLVLMDLAMPVMDGIAATRHIRAELTPDRQPWIIALTANALPEQREACFAAGMDDFLAKPLHLRSLEEAVARARFGLRQRGRVG